MSIRTSSYSKNWKRDFIVGLTHYVVWIIDYRCTRRVDELGRLVWSVFLEWSVRDAIHDIQTCSQTLSENIQNRTFSSPSVMFIVTFTYKNRVSGNARTRFPKLSDQLNRVVGSFFVGVSDAPTVQYKWNLLKYPEILSILDRDYTDIYHQKSKGILGQTDPRNKHNTIQYIHLQLSAISMHNSNVPPSMSDNVRPWPKKRDHDIRCFWCSNMYSLLKFSTFLHDFKSSARFTEVLAHDSDVPHIVVCLAHAVLRE